MYKTSREVNKISFHHIPSQHVLDIAICESQGQVSSCHPGEISKFLPALSDHSSVYPGLKMDHPATRKTNM